MPCEESLAEVRGVGVPFELGSAVLRSITVSESAFGGLGAADGGLGCMGWVKRYRAASSLPSFCAMVSTTVWQLLLQLCDDSQSHVKANKWHTAVKVSCT